MGGGGLVVDSRETVCYAIKVFDIRYKEASFGISDKGGLCRRFWDIEDNKCSDRCLEVKLPALFRKL